MTDSWPFFKLAMISPERQQVFRRAACAHVLLLAALGWAYVQWPHLHHAFLGYALVILGIVEGAAMIGWRLVQLPKSQALEFLLVSPLQPRRVFLSEAGVGLARLALISLSGIPIFLFLAWRGVLYFSDVPVLLGVPFLCGCVAGLGLTVWAYETRGIRRWGERAMIVLILVYLIVGVMAAERLALWLTNLPWQIRDLVYRAVFFSTRYNPFGLLDYWLSPARDADLAKMRLTVIATSLFILVFALLIRAMFRLRGHFQDRHYRPLTSQRRSETSTIGNRPLAWWAVRRVMEYSGRMNIWLAGGFGCLYACYIVMGDAWPAWMGRMVFDIFERMGGAPALSTGLVILAAVPAAFQYGLWDPSAQDRCRRLELLLLTDLDGTDYWGAALAAAWKRGRAYFLVAAMLWIALGWSGRATPMQITMAAAAGVLLWTLSFVVGFRAFSRGVHSNALGMLLTVALPIKGAILVGLHQPILASFIPSGAIFVALTKEPSIWWLPGPTLIALASIVIARWARRDCVRDLRGWFDRNQGQRGLT